MSLSPREAAAVTEDIGPDDLAGAAFATALRDGRRDAYERLVAAYQTPLYNLALRIVRHHEATSVKLVYEEPCSIRSS